MAKAKADSFIRTELDWFEVKVKQLQDYVDANPFDTLKDRTEIVMSAKGTPVIKIIARKEDQITVLLGIMKDLPGLFDALERLREGRAVSQLEVRGGGEINGLMKGMIKEQE